MANNTLGLSFAPTLENAGEAGRGGNAAIRQEPLQTLSFRLPKFKPGGVSPLQGTHTAGSNIGQAVLESVFRTVLGSEAAASFLSGTPQDAFRMPALRPEPPRSTSSGGGRSDSMSPPQLSAPRPERAEFATPQFDQPPTSQPSPFRQQERDPVPSAPPAFAEPAPSPIDTQPPQMAWPTFDEAEPVIDPATWWAQMYGGPSGPPDQSYLDQATGQYQAEQILQQLRRPRPQPKPRPVITIGENASQGGGSLA